METIRQRSKCVQVLFHITLITISLTLFTIHVYGVIEKALERQTSFTTTQKYFKKLTPPSITLCPGQVRNVVKMKKIYNVTFDAFNQWLGDQRIINEKPWDVYRNTSYILNKDIFIQIDVFEEVDSFIETTINLELGSNFFTDNSIGIFSIHIDTKAETRLLIHYH